MFSGETIRSWQPPVSTCDWASICAGLVVHDTWRAIDCKMGSEVACNEPVAMDHYDDLFSLKYPLCDPIAIRKVIKRSFETNSELVTVRPLHSKQAQSAANSMKAQGFRYCCCCIAIHCSDMGP